MRAWDVVEELYQTKKKRIDFDDVIAKLQKNINNRKTKKGFEVEEYNIVEKDWNEVTFVKPTDTDVQKLNRSYLIEKEEVKKRFIIIKEKLEKIYENQNPIERVAVEDRINFLFKEFTRYDYMINPYHVQPGLVLDLDITSIKRKRFTLQAMANVLNEFLHGRCK